MRQVALTFNYMLLVCIGLIYFGNNLAFAANKHDNDSLFVDFGYKPPEWQTAICLPDDPYKSIVDKSGDLLYHYHRIAIFLEPGEHLTERFCSVHMIPTTIMRPR